MRVSLVYPYARTSYSGCYPPLSLMILASSLEQTGHQVSILDQDYENRSGRSLLHQLVAFEPELIGIPVFSSVSRRAREFLVEVKRCSPRSRILLGGPHATADPVGVLRRLSEADFVLCGEADKTIVNLVSRLEGLKELQAVPSLTYRTTHGISQNGDANAPENLDELPLPARHLLRDAYTAGTYWQAGFRGVTDAISTSRGCPYSCRFCFRISKHFRTRSAESVIHELMSIREQGILNVHVIDDLFVLDRRRCLAICDAIKAENLGLRLKVRARVDCVDEELLLALKSAGVKTVVYGIESGSQAMLNAMGKRTTVEQNSEIMRLTTRLGFTCQADLLVGYPGETLKTINETTAMLDESPPSSLRVSTLDPKPGTRVYEDALRDGTLIQDATGYHEREWVKLPWMQSYDDLAKLEKQVRLRFYARHPGRFIRRLVAIFEGIGAVQARAVLYLFRLRLRKHLEALLNLFNSA